MYKIIIGTSVISVILTGCRLVYKKFTRGRDTVYKYGYFDKTGNEIIPAVFDRALEYSEDLAAVKTGDLWGYIDMNGEVVIRQQFYDAKPFSGGMAAVKTDPDYRSAAWGYINNKGEMVIKPEYYSAGRFSGGYARVTFDFQDRDGFDNHRHGYINLQGEVLFKDPGMTTYREDFHFYSDGMFPAAYESGRFGFMNAQGKTVISDNFDIVHSFSGGIAAVAVKITSSDMLSGFPMLEDFSGENENFLWGYIDLMGKWIVKPDLARAEDFKDGIALANVKRVSKYAPGGHIYYNRKGENIFGREFYSADTFSEGLACITMPDMNTYFIDENGLKSDTLPDTKKLIGGGIFSDGIAYITYRNKGNSSETADGFMDREGKILFNIDSKKYYKVQREFSCGRGWFIKNTEQM